MYRLGVVYIMRDDSLSPVFNLRGTSFEDTITNDTRDYKISSNTSIEQSNNKEITIEDLEPNNKYLVSSHDSKNNNKSNTK